VQQRHKNKKHKIPYIGFKNKGKKNAKNNKKKEKDQINKIYSFGIIAIIYSFAKLL